MRDRDASWGHALWERLLWGGVLLLLVAPTGCDHAIDGVAPSATDSPVEVDGLFRGLGRPLRVVCTTAQVADIVKNVGGGDVEVDTLMGDGVDPHLFTATAGDVHRLRAADLIFYNGLHLEGRLADTLHDLGATKPSIAVTTGLVDQEPERLRRPAEFEGMYDPHVWLDVALWHRCADYVAAELCRLDPERAEGYRQRAAAYGSELNALDEECRRQIAEIPVRQRVMVTAHDAFGYFGRAYDVEVRGLQGISTADEADLVTLGALIDLLVERGVKAVFVESSVSEKYVQALVEGCAARGHDVRIGGELYSDAMGPDGTPEGTYVGMVRHNVDTIAHALK
ncbi:MAG: zinc ABC transporter substrate-binding protein [Pirellulales bacterium]|nr:zinc ABC transporter substrate-binding protein [Planctomycetales bacterium]